MLTLEGCNGINFGRLTLDGQSISGVKLEITWNYPNRLLPDKKLGP